MSMSIDMSEMENLARDAARGPALVLKKASNVVGKTLQDIKADGQVLTPVDTGNLKGSWTTEHRGLIGEVGPTAEYAPYVEDGTSVMAPQPSLGPATDRREPQFVAAIEQLSEDWLP